MDLGGFVYLIGQQKPVQGPVFRGVKQDIMYDHALDADTGTDNSKIGTSLRQPGPKLFLEH